MVLHAFSTIIIRERENQCKGKQNSRYLKTIITWAKMWNGLTLIHHMFGLEKSWRELFIFTIMLFNSIPNTYIYPHLLYLAFFLFFVIFFTHTFLFLKQTKKCISNRILLLENDSTVINIYHKDNNNYFDLSSRACLIIQKLFPNLKKSASSQ